MNNDPIGKIVKNIQSSLLPLAFFLWKELQHFSSDIPREEGDKPFRYPAYLKAPLKNSWDSVCGSR